MSRLAFPTLISLALLASPAVRAADAEKPAPALSILKQIDEGFVAVFEKVAPAVVVIEATKKADADEDEDGIDELDFLKDGAAKKGGKQSEKGAERSPQWRLPKVPTRSEGSGFIVRADGFILTNHHVVADAEKLVVRLKDGRSLPGKLIGTDDKTDIAVVKIEGRDFPVAELGDSDKLRVGQLVCAIGAPYNQDFSFTCGWVSGKGRTNLLGPSSNTILYEDYIQTDAFINPGNSGGPLFDVEGRIIGMNTLINGIGRGLAFAIPSNMLTDISAQLMANGRVQRPWLGIRIESLSDNAELRERASVDRGVVVRTVEANAPAYHSDLRPADIIVEVDGVRLATAHEFQKEILKKKVGQSVQLTVFRGPTMLKVPVTTGEIPSDVTKVANLAPKKSADAKAEGWGLTLRDRAKGGPVVVKVAPDSAAAKADIHVEDLITEVETKRVTSAAGALTAIGATDVRGKKGVLLNVDRNGKRTFAVLEKER